MLFSPRLWMLVCGLLELRNGLQPLPQGSRSCLLPQNFCCSYLLRQVLSFFHHPKPSYSPQVTAMTNPPLLTSPAKLPCSSLSSAICIFPFFCLLHASHRKHHALHAQSLTLPPHWGFCLSQDPHSFACRSFGSLFWAWLHFVCVFLQCLHTVLVPSSQGKREWKQVQRQAVRMLRSMGTDCTVNNHVGWDSSAWKKDIGWRKGSTNEWPREDGEDQLFTVSSDTNLSTAFALAGASKERETTALQMLCPKV